VDLVLWLKLGAGTALLGWGLFAVAVISDRLWYEHVRSSQRSPDDQASRADLVRLASGQGTTRGEWHRGRALVRLTEARDELAENLARDALRGDDPELRYAAITGLGRIAADEEWAVDLLIEALAEGRERAARIAAALDRAAPRPGTRLVALLGHPSAVVRFWSARLLARYPEQRREVGRLSNDPNAHVRAAVLETLRTTASGLDDPAALRLAVDLLDETRPTVRFQAVQTVAELGQGAMAPLLVQLLGDPSWSVRTQAEQTLVSLGRAGAFAAAAALESDRREIMEGAARVLQDTGVIDRLVAGKEDELLGRVYAAGTDRVRATSGLRTVGPHA
jgi:HEAT repeat protein